MKKYLVLMLGMAASASALSEHPRIWLDSTLKAKLIAKKDANTSDWAAFKSAADAYAAKTVDAYD